MVASERTGGLPRRAGVQLRPEGAASRRLAWRSASRTTPFTISSLATNDEAIEAVQ